MFANRCGLKDHKWQYTFVASPLLPSPPIRFDIIFHQFFFSVELWHSDFNFSNFPLSSLINEMKIFAFQQKAKKLMMSWRKLKKFPRPPTPDTHTPPHTHQNASLIYLV